MKVQVQVVGVKELKSVNCVCPPAFNVVYDAIKSAVGGKLSDKSTQFIAALAFILPLPNCPI